MKTLLFFCLFLFALTTTTLAQDLRDLHSNILENGLLYYIIPAYQGNGGGLELAQTGGQTCPLTVVQSSTESYRGLPARLSSPAPIRFLSTGYHLRFEFQEQNPPACLRDSKLQWTVDEESQIVRIATKEEEYPYGKFEIKPYGDAYKIVYCKDWGTDCNDLGISIDDEDNRRLAVKDGDPLIVQFEKDGIPRMSIVL